MSRALWLAGCAALLGVACGGGRAPLGTGAGAGGGGGSGGAGGAATGGAGGGASDAGADGAGCGPRGPCAFCQYGYVTDPGGCSTCTCSPPPTCGPVCDIFCTYGNVRDALGCPTCACNPPVATCGNCAGAAPGAPSQLCADGKTVSGPACVVRGDGSCGWTVISCPPACATTIGCAKGSHLDTGLCRCVPDAPTPCACPGGQVCVQTSGGPAQPAGAPAIICQTLDPTCTSRAVDVCALCLPPAFGLCKQGSDGRSCVCVAN